MCQACRLLRLRQPCASHHIAVAPPPLGLLCNAALRACSRTVGLQLGDSKIRMTVLARPGLGQVANESRRCRLTRGQASLMRMADVLPVALENAVTSCAARPPGHGEPSAWHDGRHSGRGCGFAAYRLSGPRRGPQEKPMGGFGPYALGSWASASCVIKGVSSHGTSPRWTPNTPGFGLSRPDSINERQRTPTSALF